MSAAGYECGKLVGDHYCRAPATEELWAPKSWGGPDMSFFVCGDHVEEALVEGWVWPGW